MGQRLCLLGFVTQTMAESSCMSSSDAWELTAVALEQLALSLEHATLLPLRLCQMHQIKAQTSLAFFNRVGSVPPAYLNLKTSSRLQPWRSWTSAWNKTTLLQLRRFLMHEVYRSEADCKIVLDSKSYTRRQEAFIFAQLGVGCSNWQ